MCAQDIRIFQYFLWSVSMRVARQKLREPDLLHFVQLTVEEFYTIYFCGHPRGSNHAMTKIRANI